MLHSLAHSQQADPGCQRAMIKAAVRAAPTSSQQGVIMEGVRLAPDR